MAIDLLVPLPDPPLPTDSEEIFDSKAGTTLTAQQYLVNVDINGKLIPGINAAVVEIAASKDAAATSAGAASDSAIAANASKNAAAAQVGLAADQVALAAGQVVLANAAKADAQAAAIAAGAAAGLPPDRVPFSVLQINAAGAVSWGYGLPDRAAAKVGQSLILGAGKVPYWGYAGQQIGDTLITSRNPGALYLPANGSIRLQSAYPALFAQIGLVGGQMLKSFQSTPATPAIFTILKSSLTGTIMAAGGNDLYRSVNGGADWVSVLSAGSFRSLETDDAGTWFALRNDVSGAYAVSNDDGTTWTNYTGTLPSVPGGSYQTIVYAGLGVWLATNSWGANVYRTDNKGVSFVAVPTGTTDNGVGAIGSDGKGTVLILTGGTIRKSLNGGQSFAPLSGAPTGVPSIVKLVSDKNGTWLILNSNGSVNSNLRSIDGAVTFIALTGPYVASVASVTVVDGIFYLTAGNDIYSIQKNGGYQLQFSSPSKSALTYAGKSTFLALAASAASAILYRSEPTFSYDTATQFATPLITTPTGVTSYIKALEAV